MSGGGIDPDYLRREQDLITSILNRRELGVMVGVVGLVIVGILVRADVFLTLGNLVGILRNTAVIAIIGYAMTVLITSGEFDISVGSMMGLAGGITVVMFQNGFSIELALLVTFLFAILFGISQGLIVTKLGIPSLIVTIGSLTLLRGANLIVTNNRTKSLTSEELPFYLEVLGTTIDLPVRLVIPFTDVHLATIPQLTYAIPYVHSDPHTFSSIPVQIFWTLVLLLLFHLFLFQTRLGYQIQATGGDLEAASYTGIKTDQVKIFCFALVAFFAAFAGLSQVGFIQSVSPVTGQGQELTVIAAVIIGGTSLFGGRGTIVGTILGGLVFTLTSNILILAGFGVNLFKVFTGFFVIAALSVDAISRKTSAGVFRQLYVQPVIEYVTDPLAFFEGRSDEQGINEPLGFVLVSLVVWTTLSLFGIMFSVINIPGTTQPLFEREFSVLFVQNTVGAFGTVPLLLLFSVGSYILITSLLIRTLTISFTDQVEFEDIVRAVSFSLAPITLGFIPFLLHGYRFIAPVVLAPTLLIGIAIAGSLYLATRYILELTSRLSGGIVVTYLVFWLLFLNYLMAEFAKGSF